MASLRLSEHSEHTTCPLAHCNKYMATLTVSQRIDERNVGMSRAGAGRIYVPGRWVAWAGGSRHRTLGRRHPRRPPSDHAPLSNLTKSHSRCLLLRCPKAPILLLGCRKASTLLLRRERIASSLALALQPAWCSRTTDQTSVIGWTCQFALLRWCSWHTTQVKIHKQRWTVKSVRTIVYLQSRKSPIPETLYRDNICHGKREKNEFLFHTTEAYAPYNSLLVLLTLIELTSESSSGLQACSWMGGWLIIRVVVLNM